MNADQATTAEAPRPRKRPAPEGAATLSNQLRTIATHLMQAERLTINKLARRVKVDQRVLSRFLKGDADPENPGKVILHGVTMGTADRIAGYFKLTLFRPERGRAKAPARKKPRAAKAKAAETSPEPTGE